MSLLFRRVVVICYVHAASVQHVVQSIDNLLGLVHIVHNTVRLSYITNLSSLSC